MNIEIEISYNAHMLHGIVLLFISLALKDVKIILKYTVGDRKEVKHRSSFYIGRSSPTLAERLKERSESVV